MFEARDVRAVLTKRIYSTMFCGAKCNCFIEFMCVDSNGNLVVFVECESERYFARFGKDLELMHWKAMSERVTKVTQMTLMKNGDIICTAIFGSEIYVEYNIFVVMRFNKDFEMLYIREYDMLYTAEQPVIIEDVNGCIVISSINQHMRDQSVVTYLIRFNLDLTIQTSMQYDDQQQMKITCMTFDDQQNLIVGGYVQKSKIKEKAFVLLFSMNNFVTEHPTSNISKRWEDKSFSNTHINDILWTNGTIVCVGYIMRYDSYCAAVWRFNDLYTFRPIGYVAATGGSHGKHPCKDCSADTLYLRAFLTEQRHLLCLGQYYDVNDREAIFLMEFSEDMQSHHEHHAVCFQDDEMIHNHVFHNDTLFFMGTKELSNADSYIGIIKRLTIYSS